MKTIFKPKIKKIPVINEDILRSELKETRLTPGVSIRKIAKIINEVFDKAEVESLIRELKK